MDYLHILKNVIKKDGASSNKYKSIKKSGNKIVKISVNLKNQNLSRFKSENLSKF